MKITNIMTGVLVTAATIAAVSLAPAKAQAATANGCTINEVPMSKWGSSFVVKPGTATATFTVVGQNCTMPVSVASWKTSGPDSKGGVNPNDQVLFDSVSGVYAPGKHTVKVKVADCFYQLDIVKSASPTAPDGTANYMFQNGKFVDGGLVDFKQGGNKVCPVVTPPTTTVPTPATPTTLANTGTSTLALIATGLSTSVIAGLAYSFYQKRLLSRAQ